MLEIKLVQDQKDAGRFFPLWKSPFSFEYAFPSLPYMALKFFNKNDYKKQQISHAKYCDHYWAS